MPSDTDLPATPPEEVGYADKQADRIREARNAVDRVRHAETRKPFEPATYGPAPYSADPEAPTQDREITAERNATHDLGYLGRSIQENWDRADKAEDRAVDQRVTAAKNLVAAEIECKSAGINFINWAAKTLHRERRAIYNLLKIGKSPDPRAELLAIRDRTRLRMVHHRAVKRVTGPSQTMPPPVQRAEGMPMQRVEAPPPPQIEQQEREDDDRLDIGPVLKEMPLWHMDQLMAVAAKLVPMLDTDSRRNLVVTTSTDLGLELTRAKGPRFRATLATVMEDFAKLTKNDQNEFLRRVERQSAA